MKPTPPALKWLAEKRARVLGQLVRAEAAVKTASDRAAKLRADLDALDRSLRLYDASLVPEEIRPVNAWKGSYGTRGGLRTSVIALLQSTSDWLSTEQIASPLAAQFGRFVDAPKFRSEWHRVVRRCVQTLLAEGLVERRHDALTPDGRMGYWRWRQKTRMTLADLRDQEATITGAGGVNHEASSRPSAKR